MPKSKNYNNWVKKNYPRKCEHCEYVSNNPSMYCYHKKTHEPIPNGQLCDHGCGRPALYRGTGGKYTCEKVAQQCPEYLRKHSNRVIEQWQSPQSDKRKVETKERFIEHCCGNETAREKNKEVIKKKWGNFTPEQLKDYRHYARRVRARAQKWARAQGYTLGQQTYHVDHILSIWDAYAAGLSEEIVNHPVNLQIVEAKKNTSKGATSYFTVEELLEKIKLFEPR